MSCNMFHEGERGAYTLFLIDKFGQGIIEELVLKGNEVVAWKWFDYKEIADMYKEKFNYLCQEREING